ncbi:AraC family transcriptional regulator [Autumnicola musiva]|uniref:Helix-turn-helix domain-containing protein n=1 Tax=Autumnicola musiva TaxID=3075589 RepID=A0ABU3D6P8_9FLAO|nr:helix-turn-helix domain-containing protein [Zunongwangia sp. F117]MDT0677030.1 helix-turn-helix domain-containing protein [Zunongwangia sp. F117]
MNFITEITLGNYTYTLPLRNQKDELEQIVLSLNTMVEEVDTAVHQINLEKSKEVIENVIFNLDCNFHIISYSDNVAEILGYSAADLLNKPVKLLVSEETKLPDDLYKLLKHSIEKNVRLKVEFRHRNGYLWSGYGYLHQLVSGGIKTYTLSVFKAVYENERLTNYLSGQKTRAAKYPSEYRSLLLHDQREIVKDLHQYVMERLDTSLPKIREIGRDVGCSVSKIKTIFKRAYGDTIYTYHRRKRLEKAYTLMKNSNTHLNIIAGECGFKSAAHFTRAFKKVYGINPLKARNS